MEKIASKASITSSEEEKGGNFGLRQIEREYYEIYPNP